MTQDGVRLACICVNFKLPVLSKKNFVRGQFALLNKQNVALGYSNYKCNWSNLSLPFAQYANVQENFFVLSNFQKSLLLLIITRYQQIMQIVNDNGGSFMHKMKVQML